MRIMKWVVNNIGIESLQKEISTVQKRLKTSKGTFTHFKSFKTLFCFIIGKLPQEIVPEVVTDLNVQVVRNSYNPENNDVARIDHLRSAMSELVEQARFDDFKEMKLDEYRFVHPALLFLDPSQKHLPPSSKKLNALHYKFAEKSSTTTRKSNRTLKSKRTTWLCSRILLKR